MTQITIEGYALPETSRNKYSCWNEPLSVQLDMISGRRVVEVRGTVTKASYTYDYLGNTLTQTLLGILRGGNPFSATVLTDEGETVTSTFLCESITNPTFAFSRYGTGLWHNLAFVIREVSPHD